jgi:hypothetical protein
MRAPFIIASLALLAGPVAASPPIAPSEAARNVGACMTVEGRAAIFQDSSRFGVDIDLGDRDDSGAALFMAYVPNIGSLPDLSGMDGQTVDITGVVLMDRGKPEILLANPEMISVAGTDPGKLVTCDND